MHYSATGEPQALFDPEDLLGIRRGEELGTGPVRLDAQWVGLGREPAHPVRDFFGHGERAAARGEALRERGARVLDAIEVAVTRGLLVERRIHLVEMWHAGFCGGDRAFGREQ